FVTHDIQEAILLGGRIGIMSPGPSSQISHVYDVPLAYPRDIADPAFHELYNAIQSHFDE
ncbi:MAG: transporter ATP-binding protein, partial [Paenibacillus sp.]|nr:transporter ATP-binding protein [Paenibacillus sp.]